MFFRVVILATLLVFSGYLGYRVAGSRPLPEDESATEHKPTVDVVVAVQQLARLESVEFHMEKVIDVRAKQDALFGLLEVEDALLLVAAGEVVAGVDFSDFRAGDLQVDWKGRSAVVVLPRAKIFSVRLDSERTYVHARDTDLLARRRLSLEREARVRAEQSFRRAATEEGILSKAEQSAERALRALLASLGFDRVEIRRRSASGE